MSTLIGRYRNRREAAEYLTAKGLPTSWRTLQKLATVGGGPRYRIFGRIAVYTTRTLTTRHEKLSAPRYSTSEAALMEQIDGPLTKRVLTAAEYLAGPRRRTGQATVSEVRGPLWHHFYAGDRGNRDRETKARRCSLV